MLRSLAWANINLFMAWFAFIAIGWCCLLLVCDRAFLAQAPRSILLIRFVKLNMVSLKVFD